MPLTLLSHPLGAALAMTAIVWLAAELRQAVHRRPEATNADRGSLLVVRICIAAGVFVAVYAQRAHVFAFDTNLGITLLSLCLIWSGLALRFWSIRALGDYFTFSVMASASQAVITRGPYRVLRHPSYTGLLLALAGVGVSLGNWLSLAVLIVLPLIGLLNRIRVEEAALSEALGARYATYAHTRKRLVPYLW